MISTNTFSLSQISEVLCVAQAVVDVAYRASDEEIRLLGITKGSYQKIDFLRLKSLFTHFSDREGSVIPGGSTANSLDIISSAGVRGTLVTGYGNDKFGKIFTAAYESKGVSLINVGSTDRHTGTSLILISPDGERSMSTYLGASEVFQPDGLRQICINPYTLLLIEGYVMRGGFGPDTLHLVGSLCRKIKVKNGAVVLALPPVQVIDLVRRDLLASLMVLDLVYGNAEEFLTLFEVRTVEEVERALQQLSIGAVITDGPRGAQAIIGRECVRVAAQDIEVVDLTGAGDAFLAGWILGVLQDLPIERSLMRGTSFAAKVIGQQGARLTPEEVRQLSATS